MAENLLTHETTGRFGWHETSRGTIVECHTYKDGNPGMDAHLSRQLGIDLIASPSTWFFKGADHVEAANSTQWVLDKIINDNPDTEGRFGSCGLLGEQNKT